MGPGIRLAVKDLFDTAGLTTTYGSAIFAEHVPDRDAEAVRLLQEAGYANVGKTNLHEFAYGVTSENPHFGWVPNPIAPGRMAGGSSGGSAAALAAGLADAALGSDSGGSIRIPAACCGIVGFKPTFGLVSLEGCFPLAPSFDHAGPMARSVADCSTQLEALAPGFRPERDGRAGRGRSRRRLDGARRAARARARRGAPRRSSPAPERSTSRCTTGSRRCSCARSPTCTAACSRSTQTSTARTSAPRSSAASKSPTATRRRPAARARRTGRPPRRARRRRPAAHADPGHGRAACRDRRPRRSASA